MSSHRYPKSQHCPMVGCGVCGPRRRRRRVRTLVVVALSVAILSFVFSVAVYAGWIVSVSH